MPSPRQRAGRCRGCSCSSEGGQGGEPRAPQPSKEWTASESAILGPESSLPQLRDPVSLAPQKKVPQAPRSLFPWACFELRSSSRACVRARILPRALTVLGSSARQGLQPPTQQLRFLTWQLQRLFPVGKAPGRPLRFQAPSPLSDSLAPSTKPGGSAPASPGLP